MNNKNFLVLILLITAPINVISQINVSGKVYNSNTNETVAYVNIHQKDVGNDIYSNKDGAFTLNHYSETDSIVFFHMGYENYKCLAKDLMENGRISLIPKVDENQEVQIPNSTKRYKNKSIGSYKKHSDRCISIGSRHGGKVENPFSGKEVVIERVKFVIKKPLGNPLPIRIRLLAIDDNKNKLGEDLLRDNFIYDSYNYEQEELIDLDVSSYYIKLPPNGVYVMVEAINVNEPFQVSQAPFINIRNRNPRKLQIGLDVKMIK